MNLTKKQMAVLNFIKNYVEMEGTPPTQEEIREHFELKSLGSVQKYLSYLKEKGMISLDWNAKRGIMLTQEENPFEIPLLGDIAAGNPLEVLKNPTETITLPDYISLKQGPHFALKVKGDSMIDEGIMPFDLAIIKHQNTANNGQIVAAVIDDEATLKRYYNHKGKIELHPANSNYKPIKVSPDSSFSIAGILKAVIRAY